MDGPIIARHPLWADTGAVAQPEGIPEELKVNLVI